MIEELEQKSQTAVQLAKTPTGIQGLDEITEGGLPQGRPTLLVGGAGCGKTLLAMEFLVNGARHFQEPGVFLSFEENAAEMTTNAASLGFDLPDLIDRRLLLLDHVYLERSDIEVAGEFDLEGLFIRLGHAIDGPEPDAWCSIPSRRFSARYPMRRFSVPSSGGSSAG